MKKIKLQVNKPVGLKNPGDVVEVETCDNGVPLDRFWRDRLKDSETDNCVQIFTETKPKKSKGNK